MRHIRSMQLLAAAALVLAAGCTMKEQKAPALTGPSEFGTSVTITVSPDTLSQDGASQSLVTITARDPDNQPVRNLSFRADIIVGGVLAEFGSLSARTVVTGADGRATTVYTAPAAPAFVTATATTIVDIFVTPVGTNFDNSIARSASLRIIPQGPIIPPDGLRPAFTVFPSTPVDSQAVLFDASTSSAPSNNPIALYEWNFGDGGTGSGKTESHVYRTPGTYIVKLTISDSYGRSASAAQSITVSAGANPTASFTFSPTDPLVNQQVNFNASASSATPGHEIVTYAWDFGDGSFGSGVVASHTYTLPRTYNVVLTVTDETGKRATSTAAVSPKLPVPLK